MSPDEWRTELADLVTTIQARKMRIAPLSNRAERQRGDDFHSPKGRATPSFCADLATIGNSKDGGVLAFKTDWIAYIEDPGRA